MYFFFLLCFPSKPTFPSIVDFAIGLRKHVKRIIWESVSTNTQKHADCLDIKTDYQSIYTAGSRKRDFVFCPQATKYEKALLSLMKKILFGLMA